MGTQDFRDLVAWQRAVDLVTEIYRVSEQWPKGEQFGLTQQVRRAAVSVPSNIAEGQGRNSDAEFIRFLSIAHGSLREVETQIIIAERLEYSDQTQVQELMKTTADVGRLINGLLRHLKHR